MSISWFLQCSFTLSYISIVQTVPPDYCLAPLNRSDCDAKPKLVFSYYKPGSRCEQQTWRGCPTLNKFDNEYICSLNCIFRMRTPVVEEYRNPCDIPLNQDICEGTSSLVYTHINGRCEPVQWSGCPSQNKFINKSICESVCQVVPHVVPQIETLFLELGEEPLEEINELLEKIIEEEATESTKVSGSEPTTEAQTDAINEEPAETPAEEPVVTPAEEPAETPAEEPAETPAEEPAETPAEEPAETPAEEPAETPAEETAENNNDEPEEEDEFRDIDYP